MRAATRAASRAARGMAEAGQRNLDCETYEAATASAKQGLKNATYSTSVEEEKKRSEKGEPNTNISNAAFWVG